ncbi:guanine nucleotide-binding protein G(I)/G(S)/G(O) subunit gamma-8 isoform X2 [Macaca nemestrina]|uniref:guanine nucleotide-binding protein G(I)/G(S)/G(O) subunit gamma-8 isoform X2 n=1 Tax=Macaca nemestrina TaxID=9545 RepID=UPI0039B88D85
MACDTWRLLKVREAQSPTRGQQRQRHRERDKDRTDRQERGPREAAPRRRGGGAAGKVAPGGGGSVGPAPQGRGRGGPEGPRRCLPASVTAASPAQSSNSLNSCASFNPFPAATMSNNMAKIAEARKTVEQLKLEVNIDRMKVSQAAAELLAFCETHAKDDPLVMPVPAAENPFRDKRLFCVLL